MLFRSAYAGEALTGRLGAVARDGETPGCGQNTVCWKRTADVDNVVRILFVWGTGIGLLFSAIYAVLREPLVAMMSNDITIQATAAQYYIWLALMPFISSLAFVWDGIYIGATASVPIRNCMIWSAVAFLAVIFALHYSAIGAQALYAAYFAHLLVRTLYLSVRWKSQDAL